MLSALFPQVDWSTIKTVGFDMDGTLYDEFVFIEQAYDEIVRQCLQDNPETKRHQILNYMLCRWLEKGSSYPHIFCETEIQFGFAEELRFEAQALEIFRATVPILDLAPRSQRILMHVTERFETFLVSDGNLGLQRRKFEALQLSDYFPESRLVFSEKYSMAKDNQGIAQYLPIRYPSETVVFFGDRDVDHRFSENCGFRFIQVRNMVAVT